MACGGFLAAMPVRQHVARIGAVGYHSYRVNPEKLKNWVLHRFHCEFSFTPAESSFTN